MLVLLIKIVALSGVQSFVLFLSKKFFGVV